MSSTGLRTDRLLARLPVVAGKNNMTPFLIVLAAASPFAFWLLRRQARVRGGREVEEGGKASEDPCPAPERSEGRTDLSNQLGSANGVDATSVKIPEVTVEAGAMPPPREEIEADGAELGLPGGISEPSDQSLAASTLTMAASVGETVSVGALLEDHAGMPVVSEGRELIEPPLPAEAEMAAPDSNYASAGNDPQTRHASDALQLDGLRDKLKGEAEHSGVSGINLAATVIESSPQPAADGDRASGGELPSLTPSDQHLTPAAEDLVEDIAPESSHGSESSTGQADDEPRRSDTNDTVASCDIVAPEEQITAVAPAPASNEPLRNPLLQSDNGAQPALSAPEAEPAGRDRKPLPLYQPPRQKPPRAPTTRTPKQQAAPRASGTEDLDIRVHLTFDRSYFCTIGLLPERFRELDGDVEVTDGKSDLQLIVQEDWYEDLYFDNIGERLRRGVELKARLSEGVRPQWLLTGREIYVLASHPRASAYVSTPRLALGRADVVLCVAELVPQVEAILAEAGCRGHIRFDEGHGAPRGWEGFRNVVPSIPLALDVGSDRFYALKPAPDIQIELEGGLRLRNSAYLVGYAPQIRIYGQHTEGVRVFVDGKEAQQEGEGVFVADGYDSPGPHAVDCEGLSCSSSYSIEEPPESWQPWSAYVFNDADLCGPLVHLSPKAAAKRPFSVPMSNPLLIGSEPGQVFLCPRRQSALWKGYVPFDPVWALPAQPLICDKRTARILQFGERLPASPKARIDSGIGWSNAILDAARKGLRIEGASASAAARWGEYKRTARNIRKGRR
jgi:hypothetical protein